MFDLLAHCTEDGVTMNTRVLLAVLFAQAIFGLGLIAVGLSSRQSRQNEYIEMTYRVTSGLGREEDYTKLAGFLAVDAEAPQARVLFGLPVRTAQQIEMGASQTDLAVRKGKFWIYYVYTPPSYPIDPAASEKLLGPVRCFVIEFDEKDRAKPKLGWIKHPL